MIAQCPRCGWSGDPREIVKIAPWIQCCPTCACEKVQIVDMATRPMRLPPSSPLPLPPIW